MLVLPVSTRRVFGLPAGFFFLIYCSIFHTIHLVFASQTQNYLPPRIPQIYIGVNHILIRGKENFDDYRMGNDIRKIVEEGYDKGDYAGKFRVSSTPNEMEQHFLERLIEEVGKDGKILDFGCGIGIPFDNYLAEKGLEVTGIDISQKHIEQAKKNVPQANFIKGDFSKHKFDEESFDAIISFYAIFHIPREEHQNLLSKMCSLLKAGGLILVTLGTFGSEYGEEQDWCGAPMAWSTYEPEEYKKIITNAGFKIVEEKYEGKLGDEEFHYWVLAKKK